MVGSVKKALLEGGGAHNIQHLTFLKDQAPAAMSRWGFATEMKQDLLLCFFDKENHDEKEVPTPLGKMNSKGGGPKAGWNFDYQGI